MRASEVAEAVVRVAESVRRRFVRKGSPADPEDLEQEAALHALEVVRAGKLDPDQNWRGCMYTAAVRQVGLSSSRWISKVSISEGQAKNARRWQHAKSIEDAGVDQWPGGVEPEARAIFVETQRLLSTWRARRARLLDGYAGAMGELDRKIVRMLFGLGDEAAPEGGVAEVAWRLGVDQPRVLEAICSLRRAVAGDFDLHLAVRNIAAMEDR